MVARLAVVLIGIDANRLGAKFPGPLGQSQAWFPGIQLACEWKVAN